MSTVGQILVFFCVCNCKYFCMDNVEMILYEYSEGSMHDKMLMINET